MNINRALESTSSGDSSGKIADASAYRRSLVEVLSNLPWHVVDEVSSVLFELYCEGRVIYTFGNGGSASLASHFACDLGKGTSDPSDERKRLRVLALTDNIPTMTAWANDSSYEDIFSEQLRNFVEPGDVAFAISCSGNSPNVLKALKVARERGATTIGLGGFHGGKMKALCDISLIVPSDNMQIIEDLHLSVAHAVFTIVRNRISMISDGKKALAVGTTS